MGQQQLQVEEGVLTSSVTGKLSTAQYFGVLKIARDACSRLATLTRMSVTKAFQPVQQQ
jgi:hypothetical protein